MSANTSIQEHKEAVYYGFDLVNPFEKELSDLEKTIRKKAHDQLGLCQALLRELPDAPETREALTQLLKVTLPQQAGYEHLAQAVGHPFKRSSPPPSLPVWLFSPKGDFFGTSPEKTAAPLSVENVKARLAVQLDATENDFCPRIKNFLDTTPGSVDIQVSLNDYYSPSKPKKNQP